MHAPKHHFRAHPEMNKVDVFTKSSLSVEHFTAHIAGHCVLAIVMEHVRLQLCVLNEFLATNVTLVISTSSVRSNVSVERFFCSKSIAALWT